MSSVAITVDGVMRKMIGGAPISQGIKLYRGLATQFTVHLMTDERTDNNTLQQWLEVQGLQEHVVIHWSDVVMDMMTMPERRLHQVTYSHRVSFIDLVVDPDPDTVAALLQHGWNAMLVSYTAYSLPSWRPDYKAEVQPWDELSSQIAENARLRAMEKDETHQDVM
jgi:hypothetical protein